MTSKGKSRGNTYEYALRDKFIESGYNSFRLGGTTTYLPDILAIHKDEKKSKICIGECKNSGDSIYYISLFQIVKTVSFALSFKPIARHVIPFIAFNFMKTNNKTNKRDREHKEYIYIIDFRQIKNITSSMNLDMKDEKILKKVNLYCNYNGDLSFVGKKIRFEKFLF